MKKSRKKVYSLKDFGGNTEEFINYLYKNKNASQWINEYIVASLEEEGVKNASKEAFKQSIEKVISRRKQKVNSNTIRSAIKYMQHTSEFSNITNEQVLQYNFSRLLSKNKLRLRNEKGRFRKYTSSDFNKVVSYGKGWQLIEVNGLETLYGESTPFLLQISYSANGSGGEVYTFETLEEAYDFIEEENLQESFFKRSYKR